MAKQGPDIPNTSYVEKHVNIANAIKSFREIRPEGNIYDVYVEKEGASDLQGG